MDLNSIDVEEEKLLRMAVMRHVGWHLLLNYSKKRVSKYLSTAAAIIQEVQKQGNVE